MWRGDIAYSNSHVSTVAANPRLILGGGTAGAIARQSPRIRR